MAKKEDDKAAPTKKPAAKVAEPETEEVVLDGEDGTEGAAPDAGSSTGSVPAGRLDETVPGGRYMVNDRLVDANGEPVKGK